MALFEPPDSTDGPSDVATRALSVTAVENDFVTHVYEKLASVYDFTFGPILHPGRVHAIQRMGAAAQSVDWQGQTAGARRRLAGRPDLRRRAANF